MDIQNDRAKFARSYAMTAHKSAEKWGGGTRYGLIGNMAVELDELFQD